MNIRVVLLPVLLTPQDLAGRTVVVFDVLRATTSMIAALQAGARCIYVFDNIDSVRQAARSYPQALLCGERDCLRPEGFDLGNSPAEFTPSRCRDHTLLMSTTNGTRAILAARHAAGVHVAALVNASATAGLLLKQNRDVTLLCAGTRGAFAIEDALGAGAVIDALLKHSSVDLSNDAALAACGLFRQFRDDLPGILGRSQGGRNISDAGLTPDIAFAAQLDRFTLAARVDPTTLCVVRADS